MATIECPECGGDAVTRMKFGASMAFTTPDDYYDDCTKCDWDSRDAI